MDISTISSLTSASTKLMLANVKTQANANSNSAGISSKAVSSSADSTASSTAASTSAAAAATEEDTAAKIAELSDKLESGSSLTKGEIQFLNKNSPGTYQRILNALTEKTDYANLLSSAGSAHDSFVIHMNKLADMLTEAKAISNDSSLSETDKFRQLQSLSSRVNTIEDVTRQFGLGNANRSESISAFQTMLSTISDAKQQSIIFKYNPGFASEYADSAARSTPGPASSAVSSATKSSTTSNSSTAAAAGGTVSADSADPVSGTGSEKSAEEMLAEIHSIISLGTANAALSGVKTAGLNLLV